MVQSVVFFLLLAAPLTLLQTLEDDIALRINGSERSLSRKRRYLIFPEGSSLQLVFCLTMPSIGVGQIFTVGSTVALAWELPHDPFSQFRRPSELLHRIDKPSKPTSGGWTLQNTKSRPSVTNQKTYYNPFLLNKPPSIGYSTLKMSPAPNLVFRPNLHPVYHKVYRRTRRDLYSKIQRLFTGLSKDGRACLLKAICEVSKATRERGSFMEEIIKAIFRVRHEEDDGLQERDDFDVAFNKQHNCTEMYPSCGHSIWNDMFAFA